MRAEEIEDVVRVWRRARDDSQPWLEARMGHTAEDDLRFFRGTIARENDVWVAVEGEVAGFLAIAGERLGWLYVDPAYYGRGIGRRLLHLGVSLIGPQAWTVVLTGNSRARRLYEREGFRVVRTCEGFNAGYPCTSMQLALSPSAAIASPDIEWPCLSLGDPNNKQTTA